MVRSFVEKWRAAQNSGDFATYKSLYAPRFQGVRRSGPRTVNLDHPGWLADRQRMFQKPMQVGVSDLRVLAASPATAVVRFAQTYASGTYKDSGDKQLVLLLEDGALRISREEMLSSKTEPAPLSQAFFYVAEDRLVLRRDPPADLVAGPPTLLTREAVRLPVKGASFSVAKGRSFRLYSGAGAVLCTSSVSGFAMLGRAVPHFGMVQQWNGEEGGQRTPPAKVAAELWDLARAEGRLLVAELAPGCKGARYALPADGAAPTMATVEDAGEALTQLALRQVRRLPIYKELQDDYKKAEPKGASRWDDQAEERTQTVRRLRLPDRTLLSFTLSAGNPCGGFYSALWALFELQGDEQAPKLVLKNEVQKGQNLIPLGAGDLDGDGVAEILFEHGVVRAQGGVYRVVDELKVPMFDCGC